MGFSDKPLPEQPDQPSPPAAGDAGNSYLSDVLAATGMDMLTDPKKAQAFNHHAHQLRDLANDRQFAVNEAAMQDYVKLCKDFEDGYNARKRDIYRLAERQPLGSSPYALQIADHNVKAANGDDRSLLHNLELMAEGFRTRREAFEIARRNYDETESTQTVRFGKLGTDQG